MIGSSEICDTDTEALTGGETHHGDPKKIGMSKRRFNSFKLLLMTHIMPQNMLLSRDIKGKNDIALVLVQPPKLENKMNKYKSMGSSGVRGWR